MIAHLLQSTLFAIAAWLVTLALRNNRASARHAVWFVASVKFLIPFSLLVSAGARIPSPAAPRAAVHGLKVLTEEAARPLEFVRAGVRSAPRPETRSPLRPFLFGIWFAGCAFVIARWCIRWRALRVIMREGHRAFDGREARILRRIGQAIGIQREVLLVSSRSFLEPGVFGVFRPVVLMPADLSQRLTDAQFEAIAAHELWHVRRRDNLTSAVHMLVEAIFWFHPLVWWIGARLVAERERACDEAVLRLGNQRSVYAEGILRVCEFYATPRPDLVAGVTGADLNRRVEEIMTKRIGGKLTFAKLLLLTASGMFTVGAPVIVGTLNAPPARGQVTANGPGFEVASIKPNTSTDLRTSRVQTLAGGRLVITNVPLFAIIADAYQVSFQSMRISGGPAWTRTERYDIEAVAPPGALRADLSPHARNDQMMLMLRKLLAERFGLVVSSDRREVPVYGILPGKNGLKLQQSKIDEKDCPDPPAQGALGCHMFFGGMGRGMTGSAVSIEDLASWVENWADRPVVDQTGIKGLFEVKTEGWTPMRAMPPRPTGPNAPPGPGVAEDLSDPFRPTLFTVFDQMGLKLEAQKLPVDVYVVEKVARPSQN